MPASFCCFLFLLVWCGSADDIISVNSKVELKVRGKTSGASQPLATQLVCRKHSQGLRAVHCMCAARQGSNLCLTSVEGHVAVNSINTCSLSLPSHLFQCNLRCGPRRGLGEVMGLFVSQVVAPCMFLHVLAYCC
jgi:hypothetical protein